MKVKLLIAGSEEIAICCEVRDSTKTYFFPVVRRDRFTFTVEHDIRLTDDIRLADDIVPNIEYKEAYELACFAWENQMFDEVVRVNNAEEEFKGTMQEEFKGTMAKLREEQEKSWRSR